MDKLKSMKEALIMQATAQMAHLDKVDAEELGEVIDMIKDLEEAIYYCTITEAMHSKEHEQKSMHTNIYYSEPIRDTYSRMYYDGGMTYRMYHDGVSDNGRSGGGAYPRERSEGAYHEMVRGQDSVIRDLSEGRSHTQRRMYMEAKNMHHGKAKQLQELEKYMQELSNDMVEMIEGASPEERQYLTSRLTMLSQKIDKMDS